MNGRFQRVDKGGVINLDHVPQPEPDPEAMAPVNRSRRFERTNNNEVELSCSRTDGHQSRTQAVPM